MMKKYILSIISTLFFLGHEALAEKLFLEVDNNYLHTPTRLSIAFTRSGSHEAEIFVIDLLRDEITPMIQEINLDPDIFERVIFQLCNAEKTGNEIEDTDSQQTILLEEPFTPEMRPLKSLKISINGPSFHYTGNYNAVINVTPIYGPPLSFERE